MGLINALFDFITSFDGSSYIEEAKGFTEEEKQKFFSYGESMANAYLHWIQAIERD